MDCNISLLDSCKFYYRIALKRMPPKDFFASSRLRSARSYSIGFPCKAVPYGLQIEM